MREKSSRISFKRRAGAAYGSVLSASVYVYTVDKDVLGALTIITRQTMISNAAYIHAIETRHRRRRYIPHTTIPWIREGASLEKEHVLVG